MKQSIIVLASLVLISSGWGFTFTPDELDPWNRLDKLLHIGTFAGVAGFYYTMDRPFFEGTENPEWQAWIYSVLTAMAVGLAEEIEQGSFPRAGDGFSSRDLICDGIGAPLGATGAWLLVRKGSERVPLTKWYRGKWQAQIGGGALISGSHYLIDRGFYYEKDVSTLNCMAFGFTSAISIGLSQELTNLLIRGQNFSWKRLGLKTLGGALGVIVLKPFVKPGSLHWIGIWNIRFNP